MNIRTVIIEDEQKSQHILNHFIEEYTNEAKVVGIAEGLEKGIPLLESLSPDVAFLDIELADGNAFDLISQIENRNFLIVFVTGYEHYGVEAIKLGAFDYLLKPISIDEIRKVLENAKEEIENRLLLKWVKQNLNDQSDLLSKNRLEIKTSKGVHLIYPSEIEYIKVDEPYCRISLISGESLLIQNSLINIIKDLPSYIIRCHRSHAVNVRRVSKWDKGRGGFLYLNNNLKLAISYRFKKVFLEEMKKEINK